MPAIERKMRQDNEMTGKLNIELKIKKEREQEAKLMHEVIYFLLEQVSTHKAMAILNKARVEIKLNMGRGNND